MRNSIKRMWRTIIPLPLRRKIYNWRTRQQHTEDDFQVQLDELKAEIDELRSDQRRVAELMDVVESLVVNARTGDPKTGWASGSER